jgi:hypothetical protein
MHETRDALALIRAGQANEVDSQPQVQSDAESDQRRIAFDDEFDASIIPQASGVYYLFCAHGDYLLIAATSDLRQEIAEIHGGVDNDLRSTTGATGAIWEPYGSKRAQRALAINEALSPPFVRTTVDSPEQ